MQDNTFTQDGVIYQDLGNGQVKVVGYADAPQPRQTFGTPDPYAMPKAGADAARAQAEAARAVAEAPYVAQTAQAQAQKARAEAEKATRDLAAAQATANPAQQKAQVDLSNDEVLAAIQNARTKLDTGGNWAAGYAARLPERIQPQSAIDLGGALNTITARLTLDKLAALKQASPTGASGLGSLTEREGALLRDSVAALGQTQSPDVLRENLARVEQHYRNVIALSHGEDYRDPKIAEKYGIVPMPGAKGSGPDGRTGGDDSQMNPSLAPAGSTTESRADPALRGVNAHVRAMVGAGRKPEEIVGYLNNIRPGLGDNVAGSIESAVKFRAQNPRVPLTRYVVQVEQRDLPMSGLRSALNTFNQSAPGAASASFADAATAFNLPNFTGNPAMTKAALGQIQADHPVASTLGTLGGGALAGAAIESALPFRGAQGVGLFAPRLLASDGLYGAAAGYGNGDGSVGSVLGGAVEGMAGGTLGRGAVRGLGSTLRGVTNPDVQYLRQVGVPMTVGQMTRGSGRLGDSLAKREDRLAGYAGVGDSINDLRRNGMVGFNHEAFRQGLEPIGQVGAGNVAENGIEQARQAVSGAYDNALNGVRIAADPQFIADTQSALARGRSIPRTGPEFEHVVNSRVAPMFDAGNGQITGTQLQDALQGIRGADFGTDAMGQDAGGALNDVGGAITDLVSRQAPDVMPQFNAANQAYRNTSILADAVGKGMNTEGLFTPAQLGQAARANAQKYNGKMNSATTARPFYDLQRAGQNILPAKVPDSGTAGRIQAGKGIFGAVQNAARSAVNAPLYSEATQPLIASMLLDRPEFARTIGEQIQRRARVGGLFGAPLLVDYGVSQ